MKFGTKDQARGMSQKEKCEIKETAEKLTDNPKSEAEGAGEKLAGNFWVKVNQVKNILEM